MADGGEVSGRREDLIKNCSPCNAKGTEKAASKYCFMCEVSFCQDCAEQHGVLLGKHRVTEIESANIRAPMTLQTEPCPEHGKALTLYCPDDELLCCEECFCREHMSCKEVVYLPSSAQEIIKDIDVTEMKSKLRSTIEQLESIKINQQTTVTSLGADREKSLKEIDDRHKEFQNILVKVVQTSKEKVEQLFERFSADLQRHQQEVEKCLVGLESCEKRLKRNQSSDLPLFVELKKCQNQLKATEEVSTDSLKNLKVRGFSVAMDDQLHVLLSELESLITVVEDAPVAPVQMKKKYQIDVSRAGEKTCNVLGSCTGPVNATKVVEAFQYEEAHTKFDRTNGKRTHFQGVIEKKTVCVLDDGPILMTDYNNKILKCVDQQSLKVKDQCPMQNAPVDVCVINSNEVAVAQMNKNVVIVSVIPRLTPTRTINMKHHCAGIGYTKGELFINDYSKTLYIYTMEGSLLRKVSTYPSGKNIFSQSRHIMISETADKVYIADIGKGVIILNREGQVQAKLVSDKIRGSYGLCLDGMGGLFVCGNYSNNVVHVSADGLVSTKVLTRSDGLRNPQSVCYDRLNKRLIVTQHHSNQMHVCELK